MSHALAQVVLEKEIFLYVYKENPWSPTPGGDYFNPWPNIILYIYIL